MNRRSFLVLPVAVLAAPAASAAADGVWVTNSRPRSPGIWKTLAMQQKLSELAELDGRRFLVVKAT